jgi:DNA-directed RNA polymerase subunit RPC12/RpoP
MNRRMVIVLVTGGCIVAFTVWLLYPGAVSINPSQYHFMHCPKCGREMTYNPELAGKPCSHCLPERQLLVPTAESVAVTGLGGQNPFGRLFAALMVELNVLMIAILYVQYASRKAKTEEAEYLYFRCRKCGRRLRFAATKVGQQGQCPRCKMTLLFADGVADEEEA